MLKYFLSSYIVTLLGLVGAYFWGEHAHAGTGLTCVFIASVLAILEISLSFDNAVVNAMKLEKMSEKWRHRFITWGILIAVFGMRFVFPLAVVAIFAQLDMLTVLNMALNDVDKYAHYLELTHAFLRLIYRRKERYSLDKIYCRKNSKTFQNKRYLYYYNIDSSWTTNA